MSPNRQQDIKQHFLDSRCKSFKKGSGYTVLKRQKSLYKLYSISLKKICQCLIIKYRKFQINQFSFLLNHIVFVCVCLCSPDIWRFMKRTLIVLQLQHHHPHWNVGGSHPKGNWVMMLSRRKKTQHLLKRSFLLPTHMRLTTGLGAEIPLVFIFAVWGPGRHPSEPFYFCFFHAVL